MIHHWYVRAIKLRMCVCVYVYMYVCMYFSWPHPVVDLIYDIELRKRWDRQFPTIESVEEHPDYRVVYWSVPRSTQSRHGGRGRGG